MTRRAPRIRVVLTALGVLLAAGVSAGSASAAPTHHKRFSSFDSPSHNIACVVYDKPSVGAQARCDIGHHSWSPPPRPKSCDLDYGNGLYVGKRGKGRYTCAGDTTLGQDNPVLQYGDHITIGRFRCTSRTTGMRCVNQLTSHGFMLSRDEVHRF